MERLPLSQETNRSLLIECTALELKDLPPLALVAFGVQFINAQLIIYPIDQGWRLSNQLEIHSDNQRIVTQPGKVLGIFFVPENNLLITQPISPNLLVIDGKTAFIEISTETNMSPLLFIVAANQTAEPTIPPQVFEPIEHGTELKVFSIWQHTLAASVAQIIPTPAESILEASIPNQVQDQPNSLTIRPWENIQTELQGKGIDTTQLLESEKETLTKIQTPLQRVAYAKSMIAKHERLIKEAKLANKKPPTPSKVHFTKRSR